MRSTKPAATLCSLSVLCCFLWGCSDARPAAVLKRREILAEIGASYRAYFDANPTVAVEASELTPFMRSQRDGKWVDDAIKSVEEGDIVLIWSGDLREPSISAASVLGYEATVPARGGYVVMGDGSVRLMTAKEFSDATMLPTLGK